MENKLQTSYIMLEWKPFLLLGIQNLAKTILRQPATKVDFNMGDIEMLSIDILLAMATHYMLIKQSIIPADIMKYFFDYFVHQRKNGKRFSNCDWWVSCERIDIYRRHIFIHKTGQKQ